MRYRVTATVEILVDVEHGAEKAAEALVKRHVLNDWLLRSREGCSSEALHFSLKGLSGVVEKIAPFEGNREIEVKKVEEEEECPLF